MPFLRDVHPDDEIGLHQWHPESRNKLRAEGVGGGGGKEGGRAVCLLMHPTDDKTPPTIHPCVMAVPWSDVVREE